VRSCVVAACAGGTLTDEEQQVESLKKVFFFIKSVTAKGIVVNHARPTHDHVERYLCNGDFVKIQSLRHHHMLF
jgi:hypothetical protein